MVAVPSNPEDGTKMTVPGGTYEVSLMKAEIIYKAYNNAEEVCSICVRRCVEPARKVIVNIKANVDKKRNLN